jgi:hypothetical protein
VVSNVLGGESLNTYVEPGQELLNGCTIARQELRWHVDRSTCVLKGQALLLTFKTAQLNDDTFGGMLGGAI